MGAFTFATQHDRRPEPRPVVYVAEDDPTALALLCEIATDAGWEARGFARLRALRDAIEADPPSLLLIDDDLPDGRGGDLAHELRDDPRLAEVPLVVCTAAHPMRQAEINAWAPVLAKPFNLAVLDRLFDGARAGARARARRSERGPRRVG